MQLLGYNTEHDLRRIRWIARGLSLLFSAIILATALLATEVTPAAVVLAALTLSMLAAWRWERAGGLLTMIGSPLPFFAVLYMASGWGGYDFDASGTRFFTALAVGLALTLATLTVGWLFVSVAQHTALATTPPGASAPPSLKQVLAYLAVVLLVILLLLLSLVAAPFSKVETSESGVRPGQPHIEIIETVVAPAGE